MFELMRTGLFICDQSARRVHTIAKLLIDKYRRGTSQTPYQQYMVRSNNTVRYVWMYTHIYLTYIYHQTQHIEKFYIIKSLWNYSLPSPDDTTT